MRVERYFIRALIHTFVSLFYLQFLLASVLLGVFYHEYWFASLLSILPIGPYMLFVPLGAWNRWYIRCYGTKEEIERDKFSEHVESMGWY